MITSSPAEEQDCRTKRAASLPPPLGAPRMNRCHRQHSEGARLPLSCRLACPSFSHGTGKVRTTTELSVLA